MGKLSRNRFGAGGQGFVVMAQVLAKLKAVSSSASNTRLRYLIDRLVLASCTICLLPEHLVTIHVAKINGSMAWPKCILLNKCTF